MIDFLALEDEQDLPVAKSTQPSLDLPKEAIELLHKKAADFQIQSVDQFKQAISMVLQARQLAKQVEDSRKEIVRPHLDYQRDISKIAKDFIERLEAIQSLLEAKVELYEKQQSLAEQAWQVEEGLRSFAEEYCYEVLDLSIIPREFLILDEKKVKDAIDNGIRSIPGLKIEKRQKINYKLKTKRKPK